MLDIVIDSRKAELNPALTVRRILPFRLRRMVGPFIFMDHAGPVNPGQSSMKSLDVLPHPHIGLSTVSYLFGGQVTHRDSLGVQQVIKPGEVNWMTAGRGISHSERFEDPSTLSGGLEMIQTWVALPEKDEESAPSFKNYTTQQLPEFTDTGIWLRLIAGEAYGLKSSVVTNSPVIYLHAEVKAGVSFQLPQQYSERGIYIVKGSLEVAGITYLPGQLLVFAKGNDPNIRAKSATTLMVLGGEPLGHRHIWWNFVSSRKERIEQAKNDWKEGKIILPPGDNLEFVPLPADHRKKGDDPSPEVLS